MESASKEIYKFSSLMDSVMSRLYERKSMDAGIFRLFEAYRRAQMLEILNVKIDDARVAELISTLCRLDEERFQVMSREYARDSVVSAATVFDGFLSDLTRFVLLSNPSALPKDRQVRVADVLDSGSFAEIVTRIVDKYAHELSYRSVRDRVDFFAQKFGAQVDGIDDHLAKMEALFELRNKIVHVISRYLYKSQNDIGTIQIEPFSLVQISLDEAEQSFIDVREAVLAIAKSAACKMYGMEAARAHLNIGGLVF